MTDPGGRMGAPVGGPVRSGPSGPAALIAGVDVDRVAALVTACPAVAGLSSVGGLGTYLPGRRVSGVRVREGAAPIAAEIEVHVVARYGPAMSEVATQVRRAVATLAPGTPVHVVVDDIVEAPELAAPSVPGVV